MNFPIYLFCWRAQYIVNMLGRIDIGTVSGCFSTFAPKQLLQRLYDYVVESVFCGNMNWAAETN